VEGHFQFWGVEGNFQCWVVVATVAAVAAVAAGAAETVVEVLLRRSLSMFRTASNRHGPTWQKHKCKP